MLYQILHGVDKADELPLYNTYKYFSETDTSTVVPWLWPWSCVEPGNSKQFPKYVSIQLVLASTNDQSPKPQAMSPTTSYKNIRWSTGILNGMKMYTSYK